MPKCKYTQDKSGLWRTAVRTGQYDDNGKPISIRLSSSKSSADLERKVREIKYEIERGHVYVSQTVSLKEYALTWLETKTNRSQATYQEYEYFVNNHLKTLEDMRIDYIRPSDVQRLINSYSEHPSMCKKILLTLRQIFDMAMNDDLIVKNPCNKINLPRHVKNERRPLNTEERSIVKEAKDLDERERAFIHLFYGSGLRPAEVYALQWADIDFENNTVSVNKALQFSRTGKTSVGLPKTNKSIRTIPLPDFVIRSLRAYYDLGVHSPTFYLFGANGGLFLSRTGYDNMFDRIAKKLGLSDVTPYTFRHTFCTICRENKVDIEVTQYLMGHSDTRMILQVYSHVDKSNAVMSVKVNNINF